MMRTMSEQYNYLLYPSYYMHIVYIYIFFLMLTITDCILSMYYYTSSCATRLDFSLLLWWLTTK